MQKLFFSLVCLALIFGFSACGSTGNITLNSLSNEEIKQIEDIEHSFLAYWHDHKISLLASIEQSLNNFMKASIISKPVKAQLHAMYAELYFYKNDIAKMEENLKEAEILDPENQRLYIVKSILEKSELMKMSVLAKGYKNAEKRELIALFLAEIHFAKKEYQKALPYYDEAFQGLSDKYREYYNKNRDLSFHFMGQKDTNANAADIAGKSVLKAGDAVTYLLANTTYFDHLTFNKALSANNLIEILREKEFVFDTDLTAVDSLLRKDAAYMIIHIVAYLDNDQKLTGKTSDKYEMLNKKSPIPDVAVSDYFFDAVFILVEREIMNLPDGMNFNPEDTLTGLQFLEIIDQLKSRHGG